MARGTGLAVHRYSLIHVTDLVTGTLLAADRGERLSATGNEGFQGCYYLAGPEQPTYAELGELIARRSSAASRARYTCRRWFVGLSRQRWKLCPAYDGARTC